MLTRFECLACKGHIEADTSMSGSQAQCPHCGQAVAVPFARVDAGATVGGFRLERRLGKGGMGEVFLARQISMDRQVAVKILPADFAADADAVKRFLHEVRTAARLDHPNIVTAHEAGEDAGVYFLAMTYVDGETLESRLKREKTIPEREALAIVRTVAEALEYAWSEHHLMHRDVKPANIMVDRRGRVQLMDLGLAKRQGEESGLTVSGTILGTPHYMSPEQATGRVTELTIQTDMYSLGATLYHLVTGGVPFAGDSALQVLHKHINEPLPSPRQRNPAVTEACSHLIEVMMAKKPAERHPDWRALVADIDRALCGEAVAGPGPAGGGPATGNGSAISGRSAPADSVAGRQVPATLAEAGRADPAPESVPGPATPAARAAPRSKKRRILAIAAGALLILIFLASRGNGAKRPRQVADKAGETATGSSAPVPSTEPTPAPPSVAPGVVPQPPSTPPVPMPTKAATPPVVRQTVDLLAITDPVLDRVGLPQAGANRWERQGEALVYVSDGKGGKLAPPVAIRASFYEIEVRFERLSGKGWFTVNLALGDAKSSVVPVSVDAPGTKLVSSRGGPAWPANKASAGTAVVRFERAAAGGQDRITLRFNDEAPVEWTGRSEDVSRRDDPQSAFPNQPLTSLWCRQDGYAIRGWTLRIFEGEAKVLARASPAVAKPGSAPPVQPAPPAPEPPADLGPLAEAILAGRAVQALKRWQEAPEELGKGLTEAQRQAVSAQLRAVAGSDRQLRDSLEADVGKTVELELTKEKLTCEIREVDREEVKVLETVKQGQTTGKLGRTFKLDELSVAEKLRRLGQGDTPEQNLQRGLLALQTGRAETARKLFEKVEGPLGEALVAELDLRRNAGKPPRPEKPPEPQWEVLFDGSGLGAWAFPPGTWETKDGMLANPSSTKVDIWTRKAYSDYELQLEFRLEKGSNSGVFLNEGTKGVPSAGLEVQIQDDPNIPNQQPTQLTGGIYGRTAPRDNVCHPAGEWNRMVVVCHGRHVTVELNGTKVVDSDVLSIEELATVRQKTGMSDAELKPGQLPPGRIGLQKLIGTVWFRNLRIR